MRFATKVINLFKEITQIQFDWVLQTHIHTYIHSVFFYEKLCFRFSERKKTLCYIFNIIHVISGKKVYICNKRGLHTYDGCVCTEGLTGAYFLNVYTTRVFCDRKTVITFRPDGSVRRFIEIGLNF